MTALDTSQLSTDRKPGYASGLLIAVASAAAFGLSGSLARALLDIGWSPAAIVATRIGGAFLILLIPCLVLVRRAGSVRDPAALPRWLYRTAEYVARRLRKQLTRAGPLPPDLPDKHPGADTPGSTDADEVAAEVARLPEKYRRAVQLCYACGLTAAEAGRVEVLV